MRSPLCPLATGRDVKDHRAANLILDEQKKSPPNVPWHNDGTTTMKPGAVSQQMNSRMMLEVVDFIEPDPSQTFVTNIWG